MYFEIDFQSQLDRYSFYCRIGPLMSQILLIFQIPNYPSQEGGRLNHKHMLIGLPVQ